MEQVKIFAGDPINENELEKEINAWLQKKKSTIRLTRTSQTMTENKLLISIFYKDLKH
ncbi:hypothetical protein ACFL1U_03460 [Patescibacteria group bacterium]